MNIAEKLKSCQTGMKLYSPVYGEMQFVCVNEHIAIHRNIIFCMTKKGNEVSFTSDGRVFRNYPDAECMLFPSRDQRDWSKFAVSDQATDQKQETELKPFDKVLVRDEDDDEWVCDIFSHIDENDLYYCVGTLWKQCIAYEGNEHLLGTSNKPD